MKKTVQISNPQSSIPNLKLTLTFVLLFSSLAIFVHAFPPAPPHTIYGMVRGADGEPLMNSENQIILETDQGVHVTGSIVANLEPGVNYEFTVPIDSMKASGLYLNHALTPLVPFRIQVILGSTTNLPMEMTGDFAHLGNPGESTRIDLTLGVDIDGDGLPDDWEQTVIDSLGGSLTLSDVTRDGDTDGDGLSNWDEYIAGTYAFDPEDGFTLTLKETRPDGVRLEFLAIKGRTYEIKRSSDLMTWETVPFRVPAENHLFRSAYPASDVRTLQVEVTNAPTASTPFFYRGFVQ